MAVAVNFPEIGYTPANLRHLIQLLGETQTKVAEQLGVSPRVMRTWLAESDKPSHRDMPLHQWRKLLSLLEAH